MTRTRPDLIVPIRDRRQHRRILTLKNFRNAVFVLIALFAGITIYANRRDRHPREDFGRLYAGRVETAAPVATQLQAVQEEPIRDETAADPTLVQAAARSQILLDEQRGVPSSSPVSAVRQEASTAPTASNVAIVGGPEGITVVKRDRQRPVLAGGFGRQ